jgi:AraC family transcriptional regulator of adaptative response / DNA-3-methyladenine glycosylase II
MELDHAANYQVIVQRDARFDGRLFTAVKTTGVYCRPVCPARTPRSENVVFYPSAAAAQKAGYRPCLRCRPETAPDLGAWRGTSNTVSRAMALIELGAMDNGDVDALAGRLGVGERQLRRLFRQHLGASPVAVAQTRRVLLARQLIAETRLSMGEVAFAAGFASIRRFNETFQALYGRPPGALRRASGEDASAGGGAITLRLAYRPPYDWASMLGFLRARAIAGVEAVDGDAWRRTFTVAGAVGWVEVRPAAHGDALSATIEASNLAAIPEIVARLRRLFDLASDPVAIGAHLAADPTLAPLVAVRPGLRAPGAWDGFETAIRAVLGQQITVAAAVALAGRLTARYGEAVTGAGHGLTRRFPTPQALRDVDPGSLGMPRSRGATIAAVAAAVIDTPALFAPGADLESVVGRLRALPGIGDWTAQYIAMRLLREPDAFPASDIGLQRALASADGERPSARELIAMAEPWRPWRAYAAQHLWTAEGQID